MRTILITGAASGLGRALAMQSADQNTTLVLLDIDEAGLSETAGCLNVSRERLHSFVVNIGNIPELERCLETVESSCPPIDWIINCAGISITSSAIDVTNNQWQQIMTINVLGSIAVINHFLPSLIKRRSGRIINIASMFGVLPAPSGIAYTTSKHALVGYTKTLMIELDNTGVDVHLVCPGFIKTQLFENTTYNKVNKGALLPDTKSMMTATEAAEQIQKGIERRRKWIVFPFYVRVLWWIEWLFPSMARYIWRKQWKEFLNKSHQ